MRWWRRVRAAMVLAAALVVCCVGVSSGAVWARDDDDARLNPFFRQRPLARWRLRPWRPALVSPGGLDRDGFTFKALISGGLYRYKAGSLGGESVAGTELAGQLLPGWRIKRGKFETKIFFGPEIKRNRLSPDDPGNRLRGSNFGLRFAVEFWHEPTATTMAAADASLSSIATDYSARAAFGWRVLDRFYAGPKTQVYGGDGCRQLRFGVHLTGFKTGDSEWSAAGGWAIDSDRRSSPYLRLGLMRKMN